jgi:hypothetical protein
MRVILKNVADAMPLFNAENNDSGPGGCNLTTPYNPAVKPQTVAEEDDCQLINLRMAMVEDGLACYEYAFGYRLWG